jgi:hypothetical protein
MMKPRLLNNLDGAILFGDLIGKLDVLRVSCEKCGRDGCYGLAKLIDKRGRDGKSVDWLDELTVGDFDVL